MNNSVIIKGNKYGIVVVLDKTTPFEQLKKDIVEKFKGAAKFFDKANMAICFEGRKLSSTEEKEILDLIGETTRLNIVCIIDNDSEREEKFKEALERNIADTTGQSGQFYKGTLRSGQLLESESSIVILGDVNPGAKVIAKGNVIILGALKGNIFAGANGNENAFVVALEMSPLQIRIGDTIARSDDNNGKPKRVGDGTMIAFVEEGNIYIEKLDKGILDDIRI